MFKSLPAIEKEFDMKEVANTTPDWLKGIMFGFVAIVITLTAIL